MTLQRFIFLIFFAIGSANGDYTVTIYPEYLIQGSKVHFEPDRWNGKMGLDNAGRIPYVKKTGARTGRWLNSDLHLFDKIPENPHRKGYPDPAYFKNKQFQHNVVSKYLDNLHGYGKNRPIMLELKGISWPSWMPKSHYDGKFPNNLDAAAETISLFVQAINEGTDGDVPPYFEPINEPNTFWKYANWTTITEVFKLVATKLKPKLPKIQIGGPAWSGGLSALDKWDFSKWHMVTDFMDMSLGRLDFFSFHPFNTFHVQGNKHHFSGPNEARLVGTMDMVQTYANIKTGKTVPVIFSAHGLGQVEGYDVTQVSPFLDWAYIYLHNANTFTFLSLRSVVERAVSFLLTHTELLGQESINYSILDKKNQERDIALAFHLWGNLTSTMKFLRSDSEFHNGERKVHSHVLVEPAHNTLTLLLHNYDTSSARVRIVFNKGWMSTTRVDSNCLSLNTHKVSHLIQQKNVQVSGGHVTVPPEATCFFEIDSSHKFTNTPSIQENTRYGTKYNVVIKNKAAHMSIVLRNTDTQGLEFARLRMSVSFASHSAKPVPVSAHVNGNLLPTYYFLHNPGTEDYQRLWATVEYSVPVNVLRANANDIKMTFAQNDGRVAAVALVFGNRVHGSSPHIIG